MSDNWGLRVRDPGTKSIIFDSLAADPLFYHEELTIPPNRYGAFFQYPALVGKKIVVSVQPQIAESGLDILPAQATVAITYPEGVPTITVGPLVNFLGQGPLVLLVLRVGDDAPTGTWGARFLNRNGRMAIHQKLDAYVYMGKYEIPATGKAWVPGIVEFKCQGRPVVYRGLDQVPAQTQMMQEIPERPGWWRVACLGGGRGRPLYVRVFGRASLNYPNGSDLAWGYRQRSEDGTRVIFDSGLRYLQMKQYTANDVYVIGGDSTPKLYDMGFDLENTSIDCSCVIGAYRANYIASTNLGGGLCRWTESSNSYRLMCSGIGSKVKFSFELVAYSQHVFKEACGPGYVEAGGFERQLSLTMTFIDNAMYP